MKTINELVRELADREAIHELPVRYSDCLIRNDLDGLVNLFTDDGAFVAKDAENEVVTRGRAELKKMYENVVGESRPRPQIHTHVIELQDGKSATGRCYVELRSAKIDLERIGSGYFEDEYAKVGEQWKFASRRLIAMDVPVKLRTFMVS